MIARTTHIVRAMVVLLFAWTLTSAMRDDLEIWRKKLIQDFEPDLQNIVWNDAEMKDLVASFKLNGYPNYHAAKTVFAKMIRSLEEMLELSFGNNFSTDVIQIALEKADYEVEEAIEILATLDSSEFKENKSNSQPEKTSNKTLDVGLEDTFNISSDSTKDTENVLEKENQRMQSNESDHSRKDSQSDIQQIIDIDEIPSLGDQQHQTDQYDGYQHMPLTNKNETDQLENNSSLNQQQHSTNQNNGICVEKTEEEQFKKEFLESSESKNFTVGEIVLIDGLKMGPPGEPLPNKKRAQILKGPMYKRNNKMNGIVQEKYEISFENKTKYLPSQFLHKMSSLDNERINWRTDLRQYFAPELFRVHKWSHEEIFVLVEKFKLDEYQKYDNAKAKFHEVVKFVTSKQIYGGQMRHRFKSITNHRLGKEFDTLTILYALAKKNCHLDQTLDYLNSALESRTQQSIDESNTMKPDNSSTGTQSDTRKRIDIDDHNNMKMGSSSTTNHRKHSTNQNCEDQNVPSTNVLDDPEIWREKLVEDFGPDLQNMGWNDADIQELIASFTLNEYQNYHAAKTMFGKMVECLTSNIVLRSAFEKIAYSELGKEFPSYAICCTLIKNNYNVEQALGVLYDMKENRERCQLAQVITDSKSGSKRWCLHDIGEIADGQCNNSNYQQAPKNENFESTSNILNANANTNLQEPATNLDNIANAQENVQQLLLAAASGDTGVITEMISRGVDINSTNAFGDSALHAAAVNGNDKCLELLLFLNADISSLTSSKESVLSYYTRAILNNSGTLEGFRMLVTNGACPYIIHQGKTVIEDIEMAAEADNATKLVKDVAMYLKQQKQLVLNSGFTSEIFTLLHKQLGLNVTCRI